MIVGGQSTTDNSPDDMSIVEQLATLRAEFNNLKAKQARTVAALQVEVQVLKARHQTSLTVDNRELFIISLCVLLHAPVMLTFVLDFCFRPILFYTIRYDSEV